MMHTALQCYIRDSQFNNDLDYENIRKNADDMYDLFMNRHGLAIQMTEDEHHNINFSENAVSNMLLTSNSLRTILAGQLVPARDWAFGIKFQVAMGSIGWRADTFLEFLYPCSSSQLVTSTDRQGRVALHWAAKHFGYWACAWGLRDVCPDGSKIESYAVLLKKLIATGADVHAVNGRHETPLMTLLNQFMTFRNWPICSLAVERWGQALTKAGLNLNDYIQVENLLLKFLANKDRYWDEGECFMLSPSEVQLCTRDLTLAVRLKFARSLTVWEHCVPPGTWHVETRMPKRSVLEPSHTDDDASFWHEAERVEIYSEPYLIQATPQAERPFWSLTDLEDIWKALFGGVQDDHGPVARLILHDRSRSGKETLAIRSRASSVPPELTTKACDELPTLRPDTLVPNLGIDHWIPRFYTCPVELARPWRASTVTASCSWQIQSPRLLVNFESRPTGERLLAKDDWEVELLREKGEVDVVRRFASRFFPELRHEVEREIAEARSILELVS
jgi:hypothetical protein